MAVGTTPASGGSFNPPPAVRPGGTRSATQDVDRGQGFNPPPAVRPGETRARGHGPRLTAFQSAPGGEAGGNAAASSACDRRTFQSAPGGEAGGNQPVAGNRVWTVDVSIRPRR